MNDNWEIVANYQDNAGIDPHSELTLVKVSKDWRIFTFEGWNRLGRHFRIPLSVAKCTSFKLQKQKDPHRSGCSYQSYAQALKALEKVRDAVVKKQQSFQEKQDTLAKEARVRAGWRRAEEKARR